MKVEIIDKDSLISEFQTHIGALELDL